MVLSSLLLSGNFDDYIIETSGSAAEFRVTARAKQCHSSDLEKELSTIKNDLLILKKDKEDTERILLRSQIYDKLLSSLQSFLFNSLPFHLGQELKKAGLSNLPQTFALWWSAWNERDPDVFPIPIPLQSCTINPVLSPFTPILFNLDGTESATGILVRHAWQILDPVPRDFMLHCWASKMDTNTVRIAIAHPHPTKADAAKLLNDDLCDDLQYLFPYATNYIHNAPSFS